MNIDLIRKIACNKGLGSLTKLESKLGFPVGTIPKWEKESPSCDDLNKVAKLLDVDISYLYNGVDMYGGYTDSFVAFLDILGFKDYVTRNSFQYVQDLFNDIVSFANLILNKPNNYFTEKMLKSVTVNIISDSIVISVPKNTERSLEILLTVINTVVFNILREYQLLLRGGISDGCFYADDHVAFGPALNSAYMLQENVALNPRIIFTRRIYDEYLLYCPKDRIKDLYPLMKLETDEEFFICDYIGMALLDYSTEVILGITDVRKAYSVFWYINNFIEDELACRTDKARSKYLYFRDYYNRTVLDENKDHKISFEVKPIYGSDKNRYCDSLQ